MLPIEAVEIRGLSTRSLIWLLSCTVSIVISVFTVYFNLKTQISTLQTQKEGDAKYNELRLKDIESKVDLNTIRITQLETEYIQIQELKQ